MTAEPGATMPEIDGTTRVTMRSGAKLIVEYPTISSDSLRGILVGKKAGETMSQPLGETRSRYATPIDSVVSVELRRPATGRTILLVLGTIGGIVALATLPWWI